MKTIVKDKILIFIGSGQIALGLFYLSLFLFIPISTGDTIVVPEWTRGLVIFALLIVSGIGIIFQKEFLFLSTFYVYPNFILRRFDYIYTRMNSKYIGDNPALHQKIVIFNSIEKLLIVVFLACILVYLSQDRILRNYENLTRKKVLIHIAIGVLLYLIFCRF